MVDADANKVQHYQSNISADPTSSVPFYLDRNLAILIEALCSFGPIKKLVGHDVMAYIFG